MPGLEFDFACNRNDNNIIDAVRPKRIDLVMQNGLSLHLNHTLRLVIGMRPKPRPHARSNNDGFHLLLRRAERSVVGIGQERMLTIAAVFPA